MRDSMAALSAMGPTTSRHYGIDWLRMVALSAVIVYHIGLYFGPWQWTIKSDPTVIWATIPLLAMSSWSLPLLFLVSGYASSRMFAKAPALRSFLAARSARLLLPLLFGIAVIVPPQAWVELQFKHGYHKSYLEFWLNDYFGLPDLLTWHHLWFLAYLWIYTVIVALAMALIPQPARSRTARLADRALGGISILLLPLALFFLIRVVLYPGSAGSRAIVGDWVQHGVFLPMFVFGFFLARADKSWLAIRRYWKLAAALAIASFSAVVVIELLYPNNVPLPTSLSYPYVSARAVQGAMTVIALIGLADSYFQFKHRWRATLTEAVFPTYIAHQTIIIVVAWWMHPWKLPLFAQFVVLLLTTMAGCWAFYMIGRRLGIFRVLLGMKLPRKSAAAGAAVEI